MTDDGKNKFGEGNLGQSKAVMVDSDGVIWDR